MTEKHTSTLSSLYQQRKTHYVLPEETRKKINQQTKRKRHTTWRVAIPTVFASLLVMFVVWPAKHSPENQPALIESDTHTPEALFLGKPSHQDWQSDERSVMEPQVKVPTEPIIEKPTGQRFTVKEYSSAKMMDAPDETDEFEMNEPMWLRVESVEPLVLRNCSGNQVDINLTTALTKNQWIQIKAIQTHWRIEQEQMMSPCDDH